VRACLRKGETFADLAAGSGSAGLRPGGTWTRWRSCSRRGRRSCGRRCGTRTGRSRLR